MNDLASQLRPMAWWLVPLVLIVVLIGWETDWGRELRPAAPTLEPIAPKPVVIGLLPEYAIAGGIAGHKETVDRTLFNPTRRPAPVVVEAPKPRMQRGLYLLTGTTVAGDRALAFLKEKNGGKAVTVKQGAMVSGMLVAEVKPDRVRLTLGDESEELVLKVATNSRPTPIPATAAPPGVPPAPTPPGAAPAAGGAPQTTSAATAQPPQNPNVELSLAERRRAARAAAAQQNAGGGADAAPSGTVPVPAAATPAANSAPPAVPPGWEHLYRQRSN